MGLRVEDANRDLSEYEPLLLMVADLSKKAKLSYTNLPFVIDYLDKLYDDKNKKIADLEAKLAESENQIRGFQEAIKKRDKKIEGLNKGLSKTQSKSYKIKQQLAEKDEEIKQLKFQIAVDEDWAITNRARLTELEDELSELKFRERTNQNQTAIAELEKVKAKVRDVSGALALCEIEVQIDQQIKSLKGDK